MEFLTDKPEETVELGRKIGRALQPGDVLLLMGDLGAGKTTLAQGIAGGLGVGKDQYVRSPSFTLVNEYQGTLPVYHIDLYRIESAAELVDLDLEEYFFGSGVALVEWGEKLLKDPAKNTSPLPFEISHAIEIYFEIENMNNRQITIHPPANSPRKHPLFSLQ